MKRPDVRLQQEVGILDPFGDALESARLAQVEIGQQGLELFVGDVGVDGHGCGMGDAGRRVKTVAGDSGGFGVVRAPIDLRSERRLTGGPSWRASRRLV